MMMMMMIFIALLLLAQFCSQTLSFQQITAVKRSNGRTVVKMEKDMFSEAAVGLKLQPGQIERERYIACNRFKVIIIIIIIIIKIHNHPH